MIPVELEIVNFLAYRQPGPLRFDGIHVACLIGPNGAGKSSILDAITWVLWGKARSNAPDELIHQGETEMRVALTFDQAGARYRVVRGRRLDKRPVSTLRFQAWDVALETWRDLTERPMRRTQASIEATLHLDFETFVNSAFLMQGKADAFTTKTPGQRRRILGEILGLDRWERYEARAKSRAAEAGAGIQRLDGRLEEIERELARRAEFDASLAEAEETARQAGAKLDAAEGQWADLESTRDELVALQRGIDDLTRRIAAAEVEVAEAQREREAAREKADTAAVQASLAEVRSALSELASLQGRHGEISERLPSLVGEVGNLEGINQALGREAGPINARIAALESTAEPRCPTCGQPLSEERRAALLAELREEVETKRGGYRANRQRLAELRAEVEALNHELVELDRRLEARGAHEKRAGELEAALGHADEAAGQAAALGGKIARWSEGLEADRARREDLERQADEAESRLRAASLTQTQVDRLRLEKRLADEALGGARQQLATLDSLGKQRRDRLAERERLTAEMGIHEDLRQAFGREGIPAMIVEAAVPELEQAANELLGRMTEGRMSVRIETQRETRAGELREALEVVISDELGSRPYTMYSSGEAFRVDFALRIALSRLLARRAGAQLRSLFIDEGFGTQDAHGREHLMAAINSVQDEFDRILVITHIDELKDAFPARIEVYKTPEGSRFRLG